MKFTKLSERMLCITLCCFLLMQMRPHDVKTVWAHSASADFAQSTVLKKTAHGGAEYLNRIVFLGDSRTYGLKAFAMLDGGVNTTQVWTPKNGTMSVWDMQYQRVVYPDTGEEITPAEAAAQKRPDILVISLGFNGFEMVSEEYFTSEYTKLIEAIQAASPSTQILLQSMFPVTRYYTLITNPKIRHGNELILSVAQATGVRYLDTQEVLCDADGYLIERYTDDGCHLLPIGLDVELEYICTHMCDGG